MTESTIGQERQGTRSRATQRTALIVWYIFLAGAFVLTVVTTIFGPGIRSRVSDAGEVVAWVVFGMAVACLLVSRVLPNRVKPTPGATAESVAVARTLVATALNGSIALYATLAWMVSGHMIALVALAISTLGMLLAFPSERRWQKVCRAIVVTGGQELAAGANVSRRLSRKMVALLVLALGAAAAALVLAADMIFTEELLRRPPNPVIHGVLFLILALMMTGFAVMRFMAARASRHPRWQRANGVLLLLFAGYLLVQLVRVV